MSKKFHLDFVGIGAERSGTTWLTDCLREHPEVYIPEKKEVFFFNQFDPHFLKVKNPKYEWGINWYKKQFNSSSESLIGEFTPTYLYDSFAPKRIKKHFPRVKIICVLRNPVDRVFSQYLHDQRMGVIKNISFEEALEKYDNYIIKGLYSKHLKNYFDLFPRKNILIILLDDIKKNPGAVTKITYQFLDLKNINFIPSIANRKINTASISHYNFINYFMMHTEYWLRENNLGFFLRFLEKYGIRQWAMKLRDLNSESLKKYPKMKKETGDKLIKLYKGDIEKLEKLLKRNLNSWKI